MKLEYQNNKLKEKICAFIYLFQNFESFDDVNYVYKNKVINCFIFFHVNYD